MPCSTGVCVYPDGARYEGEWQADMRCGWGVINLADGQTYEGEWKDNVMHGEVAQQHCRRKVFCAAVSAHSLHAWKAHARNPVTDDRRL